MYLSVSLSWSFRRLENYWILSFATIFKFSSLKFFIKRHCIKEWKRRWILFVHLATCSISSRALRNVLCYWIYYNRNHFVLYFFNFNWNFSWKCNWNCVFKIILLVLNSNGICYNGAWNLGLLLNQCIRFGVSLNFRKIGNNSSKSENFRHFHVTEKWYLRGRKSKTGTTGMKRMCFLSLLNWIWTNSLWFPYSDWRYCDTSL